MAIKQRLSTNLWLDTKAEDAANFYVSVFKNSKINKIRRYGKAGQEIHKKPDGSVMTVEFSIDGETFVALNGGPDFKFNESVSFIVNCESQQEIDYYWEKLSDGGDPKAQQCGWLKDKFGVSWQVVPVILDELIKDHKSDQYEAVMQAMFKMKKLNIQQLEKAARLEEPVLK